MAIEAGLKCAHQLHHAANLYYAFARVGEGGKSVHENIGLPRGGCVEGEV